MVHVISSFIYYKNLQPHITNIQDTLHIIHYLVFIEKVIDIRVFKLVVNSLIRSCTLFIQF